MIRFSSRFVPALAFLLAAAPPAPGRGEDSRLVFAQLRYRGGHPDPRPTGLSRLAWELVKRTSVEAALEVEHLTLDDPRLFRHPFLFVAGDDAFEPFSEAGVVRMRRYLRSGGFLLADSSGAGFDASFRREMARVLPGARFVRISPEHVIYKSFYLVDSPAGRVLAKPYLEAIEYDDRVAVVYSENDLAGAWARDSFGRWEYDVEPGGAKQRESAFRAGVNIVMYSLCLTYKDDQVHIPFIMRRRK